MARADDVLAERGPGAAARATALTEGFQRGSLVAAGFSVVAAVAAGLLLRRAERAAAPGRPPRSLRRRRRSPGTGAEPSISGPIRGPMWPMTGESGAAPMTICNLR